MKDLTSVGHQRSFAAHAVGFDVNAGVHGHCILSAACPKQAIPREGFCLCPCRRADPGLRQTFALQCRKQYFAHLFVPGKWPISIFRVDHDFVIIPALFALGVILQARHFLQTTVFGSLFCAHVPALVLPTPPPKKNKTKQHNNKDNTSNK